MWNSPFGKGLAAWAGLVIDGLAVVWIAPSNAARVLPLIAQPLGLSALGVEPIVCIRAPTESDFAQRAACCADGKLGDARACGDPAAASSAMAVANGVIKRKPPRADKRALEPGLDTSASIQHPPRRRIKPRRRRLGPVPGLRRVRGLRRRRTRAEDHHVYPPRRNRRNGAG